MAATLDASAATALNRFGDAQVAVAAASDAKTAADTAQAAVLQAIASLATAQSAEIDAIAEAAVAKGVYDAALQASYDALLAQGGSPESIDPTSIDPEAFAALKSANDQTQQALAKAVEAVAESKAALESVREASVEAATQAAKAQTAIQTVDVVKAEAAKAAAALAATAATAAATDAASAKESAAGLSVSKNAAVGEVQRLISRAEANAEAALAAARRGLSVRWMPCTVPGWLAIPAGSGGSTPRGRRAPRRFSARRSVRSR